MPTLMGLLDGVETGTPVTRRNLHIVPLLRPEAEPAPIDYILGAEALARGELKVTEVDEEGSVPELRAVSAVKKALRSQVGALLRAHEVRVDSNARQLPVWKLIARLEGRAGLWAMVSDAWSELNEDTRREDGEDSGLAQLLVDWNEEASRPVDAVHPSALKMLTRYALSAPGVVVGRALRRQWCEAVDEEGYFDTLYTSWNGLRNYLDQRWFFLAFHSTNQKYPDVIQRLIVEGNLESVLDEHIWITSRLRSLRGVHLTDELWEGMRVKSGLFFVHPLGNKNGDTFSLRCHVAMPFADTRAVYAHERKGRDEAAPVRTDELRKAFNAPFWPYVLATTSVGQEGLDFHTWCDTVAHWDLCRNPVDLEQREGRIQRFGGLSIRRALVQQLAGEIWSALRAGESPWSAIGRLADERLSDPSGLAPWWVCPGGAVTRYVFDVPVSEQRHWLHWIQEQRLLYRLFGSHQRQRKMLRGGRRVTPISRCRFRSQRPCLNGVVFRSDCGSAF